MNRLVIADAHVGQCADDADAMCSLLRRARERGVGEIVYLGDAFQYLIGMSKFWTAAVRQVVEAWRELRGLGLRVVVVEGNRDFFLDEPELAAELDWSGRRYGFTAGGRVFELVHGDLVNRRDLQYRFWSTVSKSAIARLWARLLPRALALVIVRRMEAHLARTNRRFRYVKPVADLVRSTDEAWASGVDVLLLGHFHSPWMRGRSGRVALVMPAWLETRSSILISGDGSWSVVGDRLQPVPLATEDGAAPSGRGGES